MRRIVAAHEHGITEPMWGRAHTDVGSTVDAAPTGAALISRLGAALTVLVWISTLLFGLFILAHYAGASATGRADQVWNEILPNLHAADTPRANASIGAHFLFGAVLLALGPVQLFGAVRRRAPAVHRWIGRVYATAALGAAVAGLGFIAAKGTVGGPPMTVGFLIYGALTGLAAIQAVRYAMARKFDAHRAWAIRLFALAVGSWLYRMEYGLWFAAFGGDELATPGHTVDFRGWFDVVMSYFFYVPNLIVAELFIRGVRFQHNAAWRAAAVGALGTALAVVGVGTLFFTVHVWGPAILSPGSAETETAAIGSAVENTSEARP